MKKLNKITAVLASLAMTATALTGCVDSYPDNEPVGELGEIYLRGTMTDWNADDSSKLVAGEQTGFYSVNWQARGESESFKFADDAWGTQYCQHSGNATYTSNVAGVTIGTTDDGNGGENDTVSGLTTGSWYKFDVIAGPTSISVTVNEGTEDNSKSVVVPLPYYLDGYYVLGSEDIGGTTDWQASVNTLLFGADLDKESGKLTYSYTFVAGAEEIEFGIGTKRWGSCYNNGSVFAYGTDTEAKVLAAGNKGNNKLTGLTVGDTYILKVYTTPEKQVSFSLTIPLQLTIEFEVSGFGGDAEGMTALIAGDFCGWGWTSAWGGDNKVSARANGEIQPNGTAVLSYTIPVELGQEIKIGDFCGYYGEESDDDIAEAAACEIKAADGANFNCADTITVAGTETYVVSGIQIGGTASVTCAKKN